ncbi:hypothetical protein J3Q64DRAFT_1374122 [Phycomyces blakesleeanus]|uniref:Uncharacterized protein n=2 Tax=Phycomyces blakesleeanus TaxID=4837 RepID=A0A162T5H2_PHYB8|nr:hypothetical protein PHYBLDRAFT_175222 [Phycomyces blakesleeanus NRRL 1555(-)]OAD66412.1 hypothetical protein PHYBLDRAFT_175222 [Phycomyces blakesleeanus NRRL 1555(-)]|eukprot:XP_018284452.1 hypothetical protein PHYBLDRAFT_175222 [Phycomyces blakesleeanus NRRL 1555(-)]
MSFDSFQIIFVDPSKPGQPRQPFRSAVIAAEIVDTNDVTASDYKVTDIREVGEKENEDANDSDSDEDQEENGEGESSSKIVKSRIWCRDSTRLLLKVILDTDTDGKIRAAKRNKQRIGRIWIDLFEAFKNEPGFDNLPQKFKSSVNIFKCNNKFKLLKKSFEQSLDRDSTQAGGDVGHSRGTWFDELRKITLNDPSFNAPALDSSELDSVKPTITRKPPTQKITKEHIDSSHPLEIIYERFVPVEEPETICPSTANRPIFPHRVQPQYNDDMNSALELMATSHTSISEDMRLSALSLMDSFVGTSEEKAQKKRRVDKVIEIWERHTATYEKDVKTRARKESRKEREAEAKNVDRERRARRDEELLLKQRRMNDMLARIIQRNDKGSNSQNTDNGET